MGATHVVEIHGDGQYDLNNINEILMKFKTENCDLILGNRFYNYKNFKQWNAFTYIFEIYFVTNCRIGLGLKFEDFFPGQGLIQKIF